MIGGVAQRQLTDEQRTTLGAFVGTSVTVGTAKDYQL